MVDHEMAYTKAYTAEGGTMSRRDYGTGSVFQRCEARYGCPPVVAGERPKHDCKGRWFGTVEAGFTANGARRRVTVSAKTKTAAQRRLCDKLAEKAEQGRHSAKRTTSVAKWASSWLESIQPQVRPSAYETDRAAVKAITASIGATKLADLTPDDVRAVARHIRREGGKSSTALRYHGSLMRLLKAAALEGYAIPPNVLLAEAPKKSVHDRSALPMTDVSKVLPVIAQRPDGSRWALALLQGLRQAEALGLTWEQVDLATGTLTVSWQLQSLRYVDPKDPSKGFQVPDGYEVRHLVGAKHLVRPKSAAGWRVQPLVPWAVAALTDWRESAPANEHGLVWPGRTLRGRTWPRNPASDRDEWEAIQEAAAVRHPSGRPYFVHEARNTTATVLMELRVPESVRIAIMGHSNIAVTRGYEHVDLAEARRALEAAAKHLALGR